LQPAHFLILDMFRLTVAASVALLLLITLRAPATKQYYAAPAAVPRQGLFLEPVPQRPATLARAGPGPQMVVEDVSGLVTSMPTVAVPTELLAMSEADEKIADFFILFPFMVVGSLFGYVALKAAQDNFDVDLPEGAEVPATAAACIGGATVLVLVTKAGILGSLAGLLAKTLLDAWNLFAGLVLKGAILKY